jgi:hypothetical protein
MTDELERDEGRSYSIHMQFVVHENQVTMALLEDGTDEEGHPVSKQLDGCSLGGEDLDGDEVKRAWERAIIEKAEFLRDRDTDDLKKNE